MNRRAAALRRWARWGAVNGPEFFVRSAPIVIGALFFLFQSRTRRAVLRNQARLREGAGVLTRWFRSLLTFVRFAQCLTEAWGRRPAQTTVVGAEALDRLLATPGGLVIVTAHVGPWDGAAQELARRSGRPVLLVMDAERDEDAARLQDEMRQLNGVRVVRLGTDPLLALPLVEHLRGGGVAALQMDRAPRGRPAVQGRLLGGQFAAPTGPYLLAGLAGVPVLPVFAARLGYFRRRVVIGRPIWPHRRPHARELDGWVGQVLEQMEGHLRQFPEQWFHFVTPEEERARLEELERQPAISRHRHLARRTGVPVSHLAKAPP